MDVNITIYRIFCLILFLCEIFLSTTAERLGVSTGSGRATQNNVFPVHRPSSKLNGRKVRSSRPAGFLGPRSTYYNSDSIEQIKILEFIETIRNNTNARKNHCNVSVNPAQAVPLTEFNYTFKPSSYKQFKKQADQGLFMAKALTNLFKNTRTLQLRSLKDSKLSSILTFLKVIVEDKSVVGGGVAFNTDFFPYIYKKANGVIQNVTDIGTEVNFTTAKFYQIHESRGVVDLFVSESDSIHSDSLDGPKYKHVFWGQPHFECKILQKWIIAISIPFYGYKNNEKSLSLKGVVLIEIDLEKTTVNQCDDSGTLFSGSHQCRPETTQCQFTSGKGFEPGNYECVCKAGFYFPVLNATQKFYTGTQVEHHILLSMRSDLNHTSDFQCLPCPQGCVDCEDDSPCFVQYNILMRGVPLGIQSFCMTITLVLGIVVLRVRKCKVMVIGMWCLLEIILLGALFLYATVVVQYFEPSTTTCLLVPWLREVGFATLYGALVLKIYRLLADFQSRKAHRVHVRDKDLLKYLLCIVIVVTGYMAAWTAVNMDQVQDGVLLMETGTTDEGDLQYLVCKSGWWDYSTEVAEILFLVFGIYLCYKVRTAPSEYSEGTYVSVAICYECVVSFIFYVLRHIYWLGLHPDYLFLMYFLRCQLTVTITLILVFGPKLWYAHRPPDERQIRNRAYSSSEVPDNMAPESMKLNVGISSNGDVDVGEVSLADMDPEDIRAELKRLYTQLQIYKTRSMRKDNPHISKRRGGRKQTHRRFSLQAFHHKHRHHHDHEHEHEMSKTPEESTNSAEGLPMPMEMSVSKCEELNESKPCTTVSFKMCHTHK